MRGDSVGFFWQDIPIKSGKRTFNRVMPEIPVTGWKAPREFPNLSSAPYISLDVETKDPELLTHGPGWGRGSGHLVGISVAVPGHSWYFPMRHEVRPEENLDPVHVLQWARDTFGNPKQPKIGANLLYDLGWLEEERVSVRGMAYDVQFAEALLTEEGRTNLEFLGQKYLGQGKETSHLYQWSADFYGGQPTGVQRANIYRCPPSLVGPYAESDAYIPQRVIVEQWRLLARENLLEVFDLESRLIPLLLKMRRVGVRVDVGRAEEVHAALGIKGKELLAKLKQVVGFEVNPNANDSLQKAFRAVGAEIPLTAEGKATFTKDTLPLVEHEVADLVLAFRRIAKVRDTFIDSYLLRKHVNHRLHGQFHPLRGEGGGTRSGRLSASHPNLQNVPSRDDELGPLVRSCFIPDEGHTQWRRYDYSQIEYRNLAHFAVGPGAEELRRTYNADPNTDYHVHTQALVENLTKRKLSRKPVKTINFGLIYGMGESKLTRSLGLQPEAGKQLFDAYHEAAPFAKATMDHFSTKAMSVGFVETILGRRSRFELWEPDERSRKGQARSVALPYELAYKRYTLGQGKRLKRAYGHKALNRVLQGSAADGMKKAMLQLWDSGVLDTVGVPCLTVHDELDFTDAGGNLDAWAYVKKTLETALPLRVPVRVDLEIGPNWGTL
jgi:DNA polymerase I-like protein with 3'-5' exonuclease and polymerase domains